MWETRVWSLGGEDPLEKGMAPHSSILAWKIPWMEEPGGLQSMGWQRIGQDWVPSLELSLSHYCHHPYQSLASGQTSGGNTAPPISRKLDYRFTEPDYTHQNKTQFSPQPVPPTRKLPQDLFSSIRGQTEGKPLSQKTNWSHGSQPCLTQWNCKPCHVGPPKTEGSWWRILQEM